jgi:hypothetical protein
MKILKENFPLFKLEKFNFLERKQTEVDLLFMILIAVMSEDFLY